MSLTTSLLHARSGLIGAQAGLGCCLEEHR